MIYNLENYYEIKKILNNNKPLLLFGASRAGLYTLKVFKNLGISVAAFIDNDQSKLSDNYYGIPVLSPDVAKNTYGELPVVICMMTYVDLMYIKSELKKHGFKETIFITNEIFDFYITNLTKRTFNNKLYREKQFNFYNRMAMERDQSISPSVTILINERCNLNCQDCAAFVPLNNDPKTYDSKTIITALKNYCKSFDFVYRICIMGGEPFLHKEINKILEAVLELDNVLFIDIATNGTILPQQRTMNLIDDLGATLEISDYGDVSRKMPEIIEECQKRNIIHFIQKYEFWGTIGEVRDRSRDFLNSTETFLKCTANIGITNHIVGENLSRCIFSAMSSRLKLTPEFSGDQINLCKHIENFTEKVRNFTFRSKPLDACNYCLANEREPIRAGIQLVRK